MSDERSTDPENKADPAPVDRVVMPADVGDYVLATKYSDGDPGDHWVVGFFDGITASHYDPPRYNVVDSDGNQFRGNGFRRVKTIKPEVGEFLLRHAEKICGSGKSVWHFARMSKAKRMKIDESELA